MCSVSQVMTEKAITRRFGNNLVEISRAKGVLACFAHCLGTYTAVKPPMIVQDLLGKAPTGRQAGKPASSTLWRNGQARRISIIPHLRAGAC